MPWASDTLRRPLQPPDSGPTRKLERNEQRHQGNANGRRLRRGLPRTARRPSRLPRACRGHRHGTRRRLLGTVARGSPPARLRGIRGQPLCGTERAPRSPAVVGNCRGGDDGARVRPVRDAPARNRRRPRRHLQLGGVFTDARGRCPHPRPRDPGPRSDWKPRWPPRRHGRPHRAPSRSLGGVRLAWTWSRHRAHGGVLRHPAGALRTRSPARRRPGALLRAGRGRGAGRHRWRHRRSPDHRGQRRGGRPRARRTPSPDGHRYRMGSRRGPEPRHRRVLRREVPRAGPPERSPAGPRGVGAPSVLSHPQVGRSRAGGGARAPRERPRSGRGSRRRNRRSRGAWR